MFAEIKPLLDWLYLHPHWAGFATFLVSFAESLAIVGLLVPGSVMMTAIGALIGTGYMSLVSTTLWAIAGAVSGDVLSFWLGYHFHEGVRAIWPLRSHPGLLKKGENFFQKHGGKSIFLGRFVGPVRPVLPLIAGMLSMRPSYFILIDILSGIIWAPAYMLPGILLGAASQELAPEMATRLILFVVLILLVLWCISWLIKRLYVQFTELLDRSLARLWQIIQSRPQLKIFQVALVDPTQPQSHSQLSLAILAFIAFIAFSVLTISVINQGVLTEWNVPLYHLMRGLRTTFLDRIVVLITFIGEKPVMLVLWLGMLAWLFLCKHWRAAWHWFVVGALAMGSAGLFKHFIHSPRPPGIIQSPTGWSFPSGHTILSTTLFGFLAILIARNWQTYLRWLAYSIAGIIAASVIFSRLYLGAHWLTDIIGGFLLGFFCICIVTISYRRKPTLSFSSTNMLLTTVFLLGITWGLYAYHHFNKALHDYTPYWPTYTLDTRSWWAQNGEQEPIYRTNRFGKPIQILNIQWAGSLPDIEQELTQHGWKALPRSPFVGVLNRLTGKNAKLQPFVLSQLYEDRKAVLVMAKIIKQTPLTLIILRLWDANLKLSSGQPLWLGTISYHKPWHMHFLKQSNGKPLKLPAVTDVLINDLENFTWKRASYTKLIPPPSQDDTDINGDWRVVLIQPKTTKD